MQIRRKVDTDTFGELAIGDVFKDCHDNFYMKISDIRYTNSQENLFYRGNAVNLESGNLLAFENEDFIAPLNGTFFEE